MEGPRPGCGVLGVLGDGVTVGRDVELAVLDEELLERETLLDDDDDVVGRGV